MLASRLSFLRPDISSSSTQLQTGRQLAVVQPLGRQFEVCVFVKSRQIHLELQCICKSCSKGAMETRTLSCGAGVPAGIPTPVRGLGSGHLRWQLVSERRRTGSTISASRRPHPVLSPSSTMRKTSRSAPLLRDTPTSLQAWAQGNCFICQWCLTNWASSNNGWRHN